MGGARAKPEEQRQEELSADADVHRRDARIRVGRMRNGDRPTGKQIGDHLRNVQAALPPGVKQIYGRADSGLYCRETIEAYEEFNARFVVCARKRSG